MKRLATCVLVIGLFSIAACDDTKDKKAGVETKKPREGADGILDTMEGFKNTVCACKDVACVEKSEKDMMDWAMKNMDKLKDIKPTKEQEAVADRIEDEMDKCKEKLQPPEAPPAPPADPPADPPAAP